MGKSLDVCAEMREKGKLRRAPGEGGQGKRRRRRKKKLTAAAASIEEVSLQKKLYRWSVSVLAVSFF